MNILTYTAVNIAPYLDSFGYKPGDVFVLGTYSPEACLSLAKQLGTYESVLKIMQGYVKFVLSNFYGAIG